jgi:hypothetical protein
MMSSSLCSSESSSVILTLALGCDLLLIGAVTTGWVSSSSSKFKSKSSSSLVCFYIVTTGLTTEGRDKVGFDLLIIDEVTL